MNAIGMKYEILPVEYVTDGFLVTVNFLVALVGVTVCLPVGAGPLPQ